MTEEKKDDGFIKRLKETPNLKLSAAEKLFWSSWIILSPKEFSAKNMTEAIDSAGNKVTLVVNKWDRKSDFRFSKTNDGSDLILVELLKVNISPK